MTAITDLPLDVLYSIFPYLDAVEFLALTSSTKFFLSYRQDPIYWQFLTRRTFRIPPQHLLRADGARWQWLYKSLRTQTQLYTWGSNGRGNLGHNIRLQSPDILEVKPGGVGWPTKVKLEAMSERIGIVADVQCGGWSTTLLNSLGILFVFGSINDPGTALRRSHPRNIPRRDAGASKHEANRLTFPPAYPPTTTDCHEPSTAIAQYSTGRSLILGLADDGKVWQWNDDEAELIKPLHVDLGFRKVIRVVAGWAHGSIYVQDTGIVYWPQWTTMANTILENDARLVDTATVPGTSFRRFRNDRDSFVSLESQVGEVTHHILLEEHIVFTTDTNKVFSYPLIYGLPEYDLPQPIELTTFTNFIKDRSQIRDLQGSFRSFAIFTTSDSVLIGSSAILDSFHQAAARPASAPITSKLPEPTIISSLQDTSVTSIAFGDHHFHALRADGTLTAYGTDYSSCGSLGLGFLSGTGPLRGLHLGHGNTGNATIGSGVGRTVWFEPLMHRWLQDMKGKAILGVGKGEPRPTTLFARSWYPGAVNAMGDTFEREGRRWEEKKEEEGEMGAYFVLKAAAAGWHSAALVLVDEEKAEEARQRHIIQPKRKAAAEENDWHGDTWEDIDAPWEQLAKAIIGLGNWIWGAGRRLMGLQVEVEVEADAAVEEVKYTWTDQRFPKLPGNVTAAEEPVREEHG